MSTDDNYNEYNNNEGDIAGYIQIHNSCGYEWWRTNIILLCTSYLHTNNWRNPPLNIIFSLSKCFRDTARRAKGERLYYGPILRNYINSFHFFIQLRGKNRSIIMKKI